MPACSVHGLDQFAVSIICPTIQAKHNDQTDQTSGLANLHGVIGSPAVDLVQVLIQQTVEGLRAAKTCPATPVPAQGALQRH